MLNPKQTNKQIDDVSSTEDKIQAYMLRKVIKSLKYYKNLLLKILSNYTRDGYLFSNISCRTSLSQQQNNR